VILLAAAFVGPRTTGLASVRKRRSSVALVPVILKKLLASQGAAGGNKTLDKFGRRPILMLRLDFDCRLNLEFQYWRTKLEA
jgi:hypothetical protein